MSPQDIPLDFEISVSDSSGKSSKGNSSCSG